MLTTQMIKEMMVDEQLIEGLDAVAHEDDDLVRSGIIDSIGIIKLVLSVESRYGLKVEVEDILKDDFQTLGAIAAFFNRYAA
ncbi:phosphopantetheine-binding protein [Paenibacillus tarimensis]|uniref:phosphopantetheine-binding protein n=1 Tax=Paenibacillus tarimensis TaxID=416012 RepID=UPI001F266479|nr:phosphopantetheine-binding protein [Paenibacillus tarimensis]MCF2945172.1 phosphopantetheine-binding protein [Paenibacillus tarimensis]